MSTPVIRRATDADVDALSATEPRSGLARRRADEMAAGTGILAVAELDGQVAGSGFLDLDDDELRPEVKNLWVRPELRRRGVGQALWGWLEDRAREAGHDQVLLAVAPDNAGAISLFRQLGYAPTGDHVQAPARGRDVADPAQVADHYAVYAKSLRAY